jgi:hypothetical protein
MESESYCRKNDIEQYDPKANSPKRIPVLFVHRLDFEIRLQLLQRIGSRIKILDDPAFLHEQDTAADIGDMVNVVAADEDGHRMAVLPFLQHFDQAQLGGRVEVSEWFIQDKDLRFAQETGCDTDLELVAFREVPDIFSAFEDAAVEEGFEVLQKFIDIAAGSIVQAAYEIEIFFGGEIMDEKAFVEVGGSILFPLLGSSDVLSLETISPVSARTRSSRRRKKVVLPAPLFPTSPIISPGRVESWGILTTVLPLYDLITIIYGDHK